MHRVVSDARHSFKQRLLGSLNQPSGFQSPHHVVHGFPIDTDPVQRSEPFESVLESGTYQDGSNVLVSFGQSAFRQNYKITKNLP